MVQGSPEITTIVSQKRDFDGSVEATPTAPKASSPGGFLAPDLGVWGRGGGTMSAPGQGITTMSSSKRWWIGPSARPRPVTVSFSGLDGAGKTRQIDALVTSLGENFEVAVLWVPFKIWPEQLLNRLPAGFRSRLGPKRKTVDAASSNGGPGVGGRTSAPTRRPSALRPRLGGALRSMVWTCIGTFAAVSAGLSLRRRAADLEADVLVLDRYRLDSIVKLQYWYADVSDSWLSRVVRTLTRAPEVEVFLRVEPAVAYERKPEQWSVRELSKQANLYDRLVDALPGVVTLDAQADPAVIAASVERHVRGALGAR